MATTLDVSRTGSLSAEETQRSTWLLFSLAVGGSLLLAWVSNEFVFTREVYGNLFGEQLTAARVDDFYTVNRQFLGVGYLATPFIVLLRIGVVALLLQMVLLLIGRQIRFRSVFRISTVGFFASLCGSALQSVYLLGQEARDITAADLSYMPGALSNLLSSAAMDTPIYQLLSILNVYEAMWVVIVTYLLRQASDLSTTAAAATTGSVWIMLTLFRWGLAVFATGLGL